jgi:hypothetical protein
MRGNNTLYQKMIALYLEMVCVSVVLKDHPRIGQFVRWHDYKMHQHFTNCVGE